MAKNLLLRLFFVGASTLCLSSTNAASPQRNMYHGNAMTMGNNGMKNQMWPGNNKQHWSNHMTMNTPAMHRKPTSMYKWKPMPTHNQMWKPMPKPQKGTPNYSMNPMKFNMMYTKGKGKGTAAGKSNAKGKGKGNGTPPKKSNYSKNFPTTIYPTSNAVSLPTLAPTRGPTRPPTRQPTSMPTAPTEAPTPSPTAFPTTQPSEQPSEYPSAYPSSFPSSFPSTSQNPTES